MRLSILCALMLSYMPLTHALDTAANKLVTISNDRDSSTSDLDLTLDGQNNVVGLAYVTTDSGKTSEKDFQVSDLSAPDGAVLAEQQGVKALELTGSVDNTAGTGALTIHYISNGLTGEYGTCDTTIKRGMNGVWALYDSNGKLVTAAKVITYSFGISTIQGLCP